MHTLVAGVFSAYSSLLDFGIGIGSADHDGDGRKRVVILLHHADCGRVAEGLSVVCAAAATMFRAVSIHPPESIAAYLDRGGQQDCSGGRRMRHLLVGAPHSDYSSLGSGPGRPQPARTAESLTRRFREGAGARSFSRLLVAAPSAACPYPTTC